MSLPNSNRDSFVDILKGISILFVVMGHSIAAVSSLSPLFNFIYSFHMPLLFCLSGYVEEKGRSKYVQQKCTLLLKRSRSVLLPYIIWTLLFSVYRNGFHNFNMHTLLLHLWGYDQDSMWFLAVLLLMKIYHVLFWIITERLSLRFGFSQNGIASISVSFCILEAVVVLIALISKHPFLINSVTYAVPYFAGVFLAASLQIHKILRNKFISIGCMLCYLSLFPHFSMQNTSPTTQILRIILSLCVIVILFSREDAILKLMPGSFFQFLGRHSMEIYLLQTFTIDYFQFLYRITTSRFLLAAFSICASVIVCLASILLAYILCKIPVAPALLFGQQHQNK